MNPERFQLVETILDEALALTDAERGPYLDRRCAGDAELRREVESLLRAHAQAGSQFMNAPAVPSTGAERTDAASHAMVGRRIGPYNVVQKIGSGGMGEIFSAVRADGQYEKRVAIKLVRGDYPSDVVVERFRHERQILASLDHPNIARMLDGGTTDEGVPYLVMELVEGVPIDAYCESRQLSITDRLRLFRQVCDAVEYAHQRLVIHRDIKPGNIFVTEDGTPKLLDFGIAKILDPSGRTEATELRPMTPEYASPEQIQGEAITTATDVYSLGVVLYQLLTGCSPYPIEPRTPAHLADAIVRTDAERPSTAVRRASSAPARLQQRLRGDLDAILLKALRKEPQHRYASVGRFSDDIGRHLDGLVVAARTGTWRYRSGKFIRRHRASVAAASVVLLILVGSIIVTAREARIAEANRRRAEARFNDVRALANSLIFEVHDSIENIPGATRARQLILQRALTYLDGLARESANEPDLQRELATAYARIASLQGNPMDPNLGDFRAAGDSLKKSVALHEALARSNPGNLKDQVALANAYLDYSDFLTGGVADVATGFDYCQRAAAIFDRAAAANPTDFSIARGQTVAYVDLGFKQTGNGLLGSVGTVAAGVAALQKALVLATRARALSPDDLQMHAEQAVVHLALGDAMLKLGDRPQALAHFQESLNIYDALNARSDNVRFRINTAVLKSKLGDALLIEGKRADAVRWYEKSEEEIRQLAARDSSNRSLQLVLITSTAQVGHSLVEVGRMEEGLGYLHRAQATALAQPSQTPLIRTYLAFLHVWIGEAAERTAALDEALQEYAKGKEAFAAVIAEGKNDTRPQIYYVVAVDRLASVLLKRGRLDDARREYEASRAVLEPLARANPDNPEVLYALAETYTGEGNVAARAAGDIRGVESRERAWTTARTWFQQSLQTWSKVTNPAWYSTDLMEVTLPVDVSRRLAHCDAELERLQSHHRS